MTSEQLRGEGDVRMFDRVKRNCYQQVASISSCNFSVTGPQLKAYANSAHGFGGDEPAAEGVRQILGYQALRENDVYN